MDYRRGELAKIQVVGSMAIGLFVGVILAPWHMLLESGFASKLTAFVGILASSLTTAFFVYLALGFLILTSWLVDGYSRALNDYYQKEHWTGVGALLGAPSGAIAAVVWVYNHSSTSEYLAFFFGGGLAGLWAGTVFAALISRLMNSRRSGDD